MADFLIPGDPAGDPIPISAATFSAGEPAGRISMTGRPDAEPGHLLCDGSVRSRASYPDLFAAIGTVFRQAAIVAGHTPAGPTEFNLPSLDFFFAHGVASGGVGVTGGESFHTLNASEMPSHSHGGATGTDTPDHSHNSGFWTSLIGPPGGPYGYLANPAQFGVNQNVGSGGASARHAHAITAQGGDQGHNNMPPWCGINFQIKT